MVGLAFVLAGFQPPEYVAGAAVTESFGRPGNDLGVIQEGISEGKPATNLIVYRAEKRVRDSYRLPRGEQIVHWVGMSDGSVLVQTQPRNLNQVVESEEYVHARWLGFECEKLYRATSSKLTQLPAPLIDHLVPSGNRAMAVVGGDS